MLMRSILGKRLVNMAMTPLKASSLTMPSYILTQPQLRQFSVDGDSHNDFMPKSKVSEDKEESAKEMTEHISTWISENDVCVFMKGTRKMP